MVVEGRVTKLRSEHPPFFALRPPPRAIWTGKSSRNPWETLLPHSTQNPPQKCFLIFLLSSLFLCSLPSALEAAMPPRCAANPVSQLLLFKKPHLGISGGLFCDLFSLLSSRFSLRSSLFSLLSPPVSLLSSLSALFPLLSSLSALFPLLSLLLLSQIPLRTCPFELLVVVVL